MSNQPVIATSVRRLFDSYGPVVNPTDLQADQVAGRLQRKSIFAGQFDEQRTTRQLAGVQDYVCISAEQAETGRREEAFMLRIVGSGRAALLGCAAALWMFVSPIGEARADYSRASTWFETLNPAEQDRLQNDLFWSGYYLAPTDGQFGPLTYEALISFQNSLGASPTGVLHPSERAALRDEAQRVRRLVAYVSGRDRSRPRRAARPQSRSARYSTGTYTPLILP